MKDRYTELKYNGKTYTKEYDINNVLIANDFNWILDLEVKNLRIELSNDTIIFNAGIYYNGIFEYGVIRDIDWRNGTFTNGVIYNGVFKNIIVEKGIIFDGTYLNGDILFADIRGGNFVNAKISANCIVDKK